MHSMQRQFGRFRTRTADESQVAVLLKDFEDVDKMLAKLAEAAKSWRDSWRDILTTQTRLVEGFQTVYAPILGATDDYVGHVPVDTDSDIMRRTESLHVSYEDLKNDLLEDVNSVDDRIIRPAQDAKDSIAPLKKVIKKREDRKLDYEKYQQRADGLRKKPKRSEKDNANLEKAEAELARTKEEYNWADENLRHHLPPVLNSVFSILPHLLSAQIMIQNALLGHYYTLLHDYCAQESFSDPPPPATQIIMDWNAAQRPIQQQAEALGCLAGSKNLHRAAKQDHSSTAGRTTHIPAQRRPSGNMLKPTISATHTRTPSPETEIARPKPSHHPSQNSLSLSMPNYGSNSNGRASSSELTAFAPAGPNADYFSRDRVPSNASAASIAAAKKKPPPPPPPKRVSSEQAIYVTALYDFNGQSQGDLIFREGDRIRVVKKTDRTDDWWEGDLRGVQGSFPANYVQAA